MKDPLRIEFDHDGVLVQRGRDDWREPTCHACGEPIRWVLDMFSFTYVADRGGYALEHARCAWRKEAFNRERRLAAPDL